MDSIEGSRLLLDTRIGGVKIYLTQEELDEMYAAARGGREPVRTNEKVLREIENIMDSAGV